MFLKKIVKKNIKPVLILGIIFCIYIFNTINVFAASDVSFGGYQFTSYNKGESYTVDDTAAGGTITLTQDAKMVDPAVGVHVDQSDPSKISTMVVADSAGNKVELSLDQNGNIRQIIDDKNSKVYWAKASTVTGVGTASINDTKLQGVLNDFGQKSGYQGNLFQDVIKQRNIYYNNKLISLLNGTNKCEVKDTLLGSYAGTVNTDVKNGVLTASQGQAIKDAIKGNSSWTPDTAQQFKSAMNANLSNFQSAFYWGDAQQAVECAFINAASQGDKDKAIATLQQLNQTGGGISSLTSEQLKNLRSTANVGPTSGGGVGSAQEVAAEVTGTVNKAAEQTQSEQLDQCTTFSISGGFAINLSACFANILYFILSILAFFLGIVGEFFNLVFDVTLVNMKANISNIGIINTGWATIRDFANILFIFMLLYLAISTILQLDDHGVKRGLSRLIVGAVLINFSLFFVKIPIDVSNILAIEIYDKITVNGEQNGAAGGYLGLGDAIMAMFSPQQVFNNSTLDPKTINQASAKGQSANETGWNLQKNPVTTFAMGIVIIFISLIVFLAVCIIFIKRFITLVLLMIFSPLAFAGMAVPNHDIEHQISSSFWGSLLRESFYAPVFMFMIYLTIEVGTALNKSNTALVSSAGQGLLANLTTVPVTNIISYSVVVGMMIFSLTVSETMGVKGAEGAIKFFDSARGMATDWAATNTIGRLAHTTLNKGASASFLADRAANGNFLTKNLARGTQVVLKNVGKGFGEKVHREEEYKKAHDGEEHDNPKVRANMLMKDINDDGTVNTMRSGVQANDIMAHHWNAEENANVKLSLEKIKKEAEATIADSRKSAKEKDEAKIALNKAQGALMRYYTGGHDVNGKHVHARLTPEMANKVARAEFGELDHYNDEFRSILNNEKKTATEKAEEIKKFIQNAKSEAAVVGALKSAGESMNVMKGNTPEATLLKQSLSDALRDKFNGEAAYANIAKDPIIDREIRAAISAGGYYAKMTADIFDTLTNDKLNSATGYTIGEEAKMTPAITDKFIELLKKIENDEIKAAVASGNIDNMIAKYKELKLGDDRPTQNFFSKDNALRSQTQSNQVVNELEYLANNGVKGMYSNK